MLDKVLAGAAKDVSDNGDIHLRHRYWLEVQIDCSNRECNEYPNSAARFDQVLPGIFVIGQAAAAIDFSRKGVV